MIKVVVEIAVDSFGAECVGRAQGWLRDIDVQGELHLPYWLAPGSPPTAQDFWSEAYPRWDSYALSHPYDPAVHGSGFDVDRAAIATAVRQWTIAGDGGRAFLNWAQHARPAELEGAREIVDPMFVIAGTLADPVSAATILGLLAGLARLRRIGAFATPVYAVLGVGFRGGPWSSDEERVRALVARNLLDFQSFFGGDPENVADRAAYTLLVGDEPIGVGASDRAAQTALGGMGIIAMTRSFRAEHLASKPLDTPTPFRFDGAKETFDASRPFAAVGGYAVYAPITLMSRLLSARLCMEAFEKLSTQTRYETIEECAKLDPEKLPDRLPQLIADAVNTTLARTWQLVADRDRIAWRPEADTFTRRSFIAFADLKEIYGDMFKSDEWNRLIDAYGLKRLKKVPVQDWGRALDDLTNAIEQGLRPRRRRQNTLLSRAVAVSLLESIGRSLRELFRRTFDEEVHAEPHRVAQAYMGELFKRIKRDGEDLKDELNRQALERRSSQSVTRADLDRARSKLDEDFANVPSPSAVFVRFIPAWALAIVAAFLPFDFLPHEPRVRFLLGVCVGLGLVFTMFSVWVAGVVWPLLKAIRQWISNYKLVLKYEEEAERDRAFVKLAETLLACVRWEFSGESTLPPIPEGIRIRVEKEAHDVPDADLDSLRAQTVLSDYSGYLRRAHGSYEEVVRKLISSLDRSRLETVLPVIDLKSMQPLERQYVDLFGGEKDRRGDENLNIAESGMSRVRIAARDGSKREPFPFCEEPPFAPGESPDGAPAWRRTFIMPDGAALLDEGAQDASSAFRCFDAIADYVESRHTIDLAYELASMSEKRAISDTDLYRAFANLSTPSVATDANDVQHYLIAPTSTYLLAANLSATTQVVQGQLIMHLQIAPRLSAETIISYPNATRPTNAMGLAWRTYVAEKWAERAFTPVTLPPEATS